MAETLSPTVHGVSAIVRLDQACLALTCIGVRFCLSSRGNWSTIAAIAANSPNLIAIFPIDPPCDVAEKFWNETQWTFAGGLDEQ